MRESSKKHEQKSKSSSCSCFLLELLFIVQKTAPARGAVQGPPGPDIGCRLRLARHLFLKHFFEGLFSQKSRGLKENGTQNGSHFCSFLVFFAGRRICEKRAGTRARTLPSEFGGVQKSYFFHLKKETPQETLLKPIFYRF